MATKVLYLVFISLLSYASCQQQQGQNPRGDSPSLPKPDDTRQSQNANNQKQNANVPQAPVGSGAVGSSPMDDGDIINLAEHPACAADVKRLCDGLPLKTEGDAAKQAKNSLDVLECFLNHDDRAVSADCHQIMWDFKKNVTNDKRISGIAEQQCAEDIKSAKGLAPCAQWRNDPGHFISCLVEEKKEIQTDSCRSFVNKVATVIFTDYRLVGFFTQACGADIKRLKCGYLDTKGQAGHSQGAAISCLVHNLQQQKQLELKAKEDPQAKSELDKMGSVNEECGHQLMRLLELQSDDFHLDRALFFACRYDREMFCHQTKAGQGRVYQCLLQNVNQEQMSTECKEKLKEREIAAQSDYKVDYGMANMCQAEIKKHQCVPPPGYQQHQELGMSYVIICLENAMHKTGQQEFNPQCLQAMHFHRQAMMSNYNLSPNIVIFCKKDIEEHCSKNVQPQAIIHCLMGIAKDKKKVGSGDAMRLESMLSPICHKEISDLMMMVDPANDVKVDNLLYQACSNVISTKCGAAAQNSPAMHVMGCLMENMHAEEMTDTCERYLLETHYFVTRDIRLDAELFDACRNEATDLCGVKDDWAPDKKDQTPQTGPVAYACLYRHAFEQGPDKTGLSPKCLEQVKVTMHQRAKAGDLPAVLEQVCIHDLAYFCSDHPKRLQRGEELNCLQTNYAKLQDECKANVHRFSEAQDRDMKLSATYYNCAPMLMKFCANVLTAQSTFDDAMDCLIPNKEEVTKLSRNCSAEIEHYQIINMKEFNLNFRFKESCRVDVETFCKETAGQEIGEMVLCLSSINREDVLKDEVQPRLSKGCRKQLRSELLARAANPTQDPVIANACGDDITKLCPAVSTVDVLECLRTHTDKLSSACHQKIFKVEQAQAVDEYADFTLVKACRRVIEKHCRDVEGHQLLPCLVEVKKEPDMDDKCRQMVIKRQIEEAKDARLNPSLYKGCRQDLEKFCKDELKKIDQSQKEVTADVEERLVGCLRKYKKRLSDGCSKEIDTLLKEVALDYRLDPNLANVCQQDIKTCAEGDADEKGKVLECLKNLLKKHQLHGGCPAQVARLVAEGKADLHVDPNLYAACQLDLKKMCFDIQPGEGRQFQCLTNAMSDGRKLGKQCAERLKERMDFVKYASEIEPIENMEQLVESVVESPARYYFLAVLGGAVFALLCIGICCGRATKRVRRELKNR